MPVRETRTLRPIIAWRLGRYAPDADEPLRDVLASHPFHLLAEHGRSASPGSAGSCGRSATRSCASTGPRRSGRGTSRGYCKVVVRHEVRAHGAGSEIVSEVRIWCTDRRAQLRFRPYWAFIGPFSRFIGSELLSAATRRAERTSAADGLSVAAGDVDRRACPGACAAR